MFDFRVRFIVAKFLKINCMQQLTNRVTTKIHNFHHTQKKQNKKHHINKFMPTASQSSGEVCDVVAF